MLASALTLVKIGIYHQLAYVDTKNSSMSSMFKSSELLLLI